MIVIFTFALLVLLAIGVPVAFSLGASGLLGMVLFMPGDGALEQIPILAYKALDDFVLCAVPLYILMSAILLKGKVGEDLFDLGNKWLRHLCRDYRFQCGLRGHSRSHCHSGNAETGL